IESVTVVSENKILEENIQSRFHKYSGKLFTETILGKVSATSNDYFQRYRYLKAKLLQKDVSYNEDKTVAHLRYVVDYPFKFEIYFSGNDNFSMSDLFRAVDLQSINNSTLSPAREIVERLRKEYLQQGYANVRINYDVEEDSKEFKRKVKIKIDEGHRIKIGSLQFTGHISRPSDYYGKFVKSNSTELIARGYYNREDLNLAFENLTTHLKNQGFLHAKVRSIRMDYNKRKDAANITADLDEGPLTQIRKIRFQGNKAFQRIELEKLLLISNNSPLHLRDLEESLQNLTDFYKSHGYLEANISQDRSKLVRYNKTETQADIYFEIFEGPQVIVDSVRIEGNVHLLDEVILRESELVPGMVLTPDDILEAKGRLNKLDVFSNIEIDTNNKFTTTSKRTVIVKVTERKPGLFKVGAGFTDENQITVHGFTGVSFVWPSTRVLSTRGEVSESLAEPHFPEYKVTVGYLEPYLFKSNWKGRVNLSRKVVVDEYFPSQKVATIFESNKLAFLVERNVTSKFKFIWNFWTKEQNRSILNDPTKTLLVPKTDGSPPETFEPSTQDIVTIGPALDYDARDNPFLPTEGYLLRFNMDYSDPIIGSSEKINFYRYQAQANHYLKFGRTVWANSARAGYGKNLSDESGSGIPTSHAFFLGGISTLRGFGGNSTYERIPNGIELPVVDGSNDLIISDDTTFYLYKSEFRFTVWDSFGLALFYDAGSVTVKGIKMENPIRQAIGFGLRYNTPVGPVSLDIGFKVDPQEGEDKYRVHFSFGTF
ncbi:MAG: BamA/TamA family outer membrane protein, partial [Bdellovibrionales bacterium]|nr:BamA/TamA family outer membrane protein [Bdellovibrionales bacterium]